MPLNGNDGCHSTIAAMRKGASELSVAIEAKDDGASFVALGRRIAYEGWGLFVIALLALASLPFGGLRAWLDDLSPGLLVTLLLALAVIGAFVVAAGYGARTVGATFARARAETPKRR